MAQQRESEKEVVSRGPSVTVGGGNVRIEFKIEELVDHLTRQVPPRWVIVASCSGCNGCSA